jgi:SagB-type dehydrogenase family enzyme
MSFISDLHTYLRTTRVSMRGSTKKPSEVPRGTHKAYSRMPQIPLETPRIETPLSDLLTKRKSYSAATETPLSIQDIGLIFGNALSRRSEGVSRNYPSGGALYPIETYLVCEKLVGAPSGVFHYNPSSNSLEHLWELPPGLSISDLTPKPASLAPTALVIFTSVWERSSAKYGHFTYMVALLEAGHMSENILLAATAASISVRPLTGFRDNRIIKLLDIDPSLEQPVLTVALSR